MSRIPDKFELVHATGLYDTYTPILQMKSLQQLGSLLNLVFSRCDPIEVELLNARRLCTITFKRAGDDEFIATYNINYSPDNPGDRRFEFTIMYAIGIYTTTVVGYGTTLELAIRDVHSSYYVNDHVPTTLSRLFWYDGKEYHVYQSIILDASEHPEDYFDRLVEALCKDSNPYILREFPGFDIRVESTATLDGKVVSFNPMHAYPTDEGESIIDKYVVPKLF